MLILNSPKLARSFGKLLALIFLFAISNLIWAENNSMRQTKSKLKELDNRINQLKQNLSAAQDRRGLLNEELGSTERQIGDGIHKLRTIQLTMNSKQQKINLLQQNVNELNKQFLAQQQLLADHVRIHYKIGEYQPIKWLLNQDDPYKISRLLTYHQYLMKSRLKVIDQIDATKINLGRNQESLKQELLNQQRIQNQLALHQQELEQNQRYRKTVLQSLNNEIQNKQLTLSEFEQNKKNLAQLLQTLASQSVMQNHQPFNKMRKKLPRPLRTTKQALQKWNQGVTFFAGEGTPVTAVYSGKVVFSDWLNGYGLLLILDHGEGFMTLYGHNQSLFKSKGATVQQGEQIATVGHSGGIKQNGLYFEVRHRGKAVSPLDWLA